MKWTDYKASYITPQMTLLEKFNAILKYLDGEVDEFLHTISIKGKNNSNQVITRTVILVNKNETKILTIEDLQKARVSKFCFVTKMQIPNSEYYKDIESFQINSSILTIKFYSGLDEVINDAEILTDVVEEL